MSWKFRKVSSADSDQVLNWRNNPLIYKHLFHPQPVEKLEHEKWFANILANPNVLFLMATFENGTVGTVRFDLNENQTEAEIGIYLDPAFHGKGLSSSMLQEAEKIVVESFPSLKKLVARVVSENAPSQKMFVRSGYVEKFIVLEKLVESDNGD